MPSPVNPNRPPLSALESPERVPLDVIVVAREVAAALKEIHDTATELRLPSQTFAELVADTDRSRGEEAGLRARRMADLSETFARRIERAVVGTDIEEPVREYLALVRLLNPATNFDRLRREERLAALMVIGEEQEGAPIDPARCAEDMDELMEKRQDELESAPAVQLIGGTFRALYHVAAGSMMVDYFLTGPKVALESKEFYPFAEHIRNETKVEVRGSLLFFEDVPAHGHKGLWYGRPGHHAAMVISDDPTWIERRRCTSVAQVFDAPVVRGALPLQDVLHFVNHMTVPKEVGPAAEQIVDLLSGEISSRLAMELVYRHREEIVTFQTGVSPIAVVRSAVCDSFTKRCLKENLDNPMSSALSESMRGEFEMCFNRSVAEALFAVEADAILGSREATVLDSILRLLPANRWKDITTEVLSGFYGRERAEDALAIAESVLFRSFDSELSEAAMSAILRMGTEFNDRAAEALRSLFESHIMGGAPKDPVTAPLTEAEFIRDSDRIIAVAGILKYDVDSARDSIAVKRYEHLLLWAFQEGSDDFSRAAEYFAALPEGPKEAIVEFLINVADEDELEKMFPNGARGLCENPGRFGITGHYASDLIEALG